MKKTQVIAKLRAAGMFIHQGYSLSKALEGVGLDPMYGKAFSGADYTLFPNQYPRPTGDFYLSYRKGYLTTVRIQEEK